ncbi:cell wall protein Ecm33, partial [Massospora cicadina]
KPFDSGIEEVEQVLALARAENTCWNGDQDGKHFEICTEDDGRPFKLGGAIAARELKFDCPKSRVIEVSSAIVEKIEIEGACEFDDLILRGAHSLESITFSKRSRSETISIQNVDNSDSLSILNLDIGSVDISHTKLKSILFGTEVSVHSLTVKDANNLVNLKIPTLAREAKSVSIQGTKRLAEIQTIIGEVEVADKFRLHFYDSQTFSLKLKHAAQLDLVSGTGGSVHFPHLDKVTNSVSILWEPHVGSLLLPALTEVGTLDIVFRGAELVLNSSLSWREASKISSPKFCEKYAGVFEAKNYATSAGRKCPDSSCVGRVELDVGDLKGVMSCKDIIGELNIQTKPKTKFSFKKLEHIIGDLVLKEVDMDYLDFQSLNVIDYKLTIQGSKNLKEKAFEALSKVGEMEVDDVSGSLIMDNLKTCGDMTIQNTNLKKISFAELTTTKDFELIANKQLTTLRLNKLTQTDELKLNGCPDLKTYTFRHGLNVGGNLYIKDCFATDIDLPIKSVGKTCTLKPTAKVTRIALNRLESTGDFTYEPGHEGTLELGQLTASNLFNMHRKANKLTLNQGLIWKKDSGDEAKFYAKNFCGDYQSAFRGKSYVGNPRGKTPECSSSICEVDVALTAENELNALKCKSIKGNYHIRGDLHQPLKLTNRVLIHEDLESIDGDLIIENIFLDNISFEKLNSVKGNIVLKDVDDKSIIEFLRLSSAQHIKLVEVGDSVLHFKLLEDTASLDIANSTLTNFSAPKLSTAGTLSFSSNPKLNSVHLPKLKSVGQLKFEENPQLESAVFGDATVVERDLNITNSFKGRATVPLKEVKGAIHLNLNQGLSSFTFPTLISSGDLYFNSTHVLDEFNLPSMTKTESIRMETKVNDIKLNKDLVWRDYSNDRAIFYAEGFCSKYGDLFKGRNYTEKASRCESNLCEAASVVLTDDNYLHILKCTHLQGDYTIGDGYSQASMVHLNLVKVDGTLTFNGVSHNFKEVNFNALESVGSIVTNVTAGSLRIAYPKLITCAAISATGNGVSTLEFDQLTFCSKVSITNSNLVAFSASALDHLQALEILNNRALDQVNLPALRTIGGDLDILNNPKLREMELAAIDTICGHLSIDNSFKAGLTLPIRNVTGSISISLTRQSTVLYLDQLQHCGGPFNLSSASVLSTLRLESLDFANGFTMESKVEYLHLKETLAWAGRAEFYATNFCRDYGLKFKGRNYIAKSDSCRSDLCQNTITLTDANYADAIRCKEIDGDFIIGSEFTSTRLDHAGLVRVKGSLIIEGATEAITLDNISTLGEANYIVEDSKPQPSRGNLIVRNSGIQRFSAKGLNKVSKVELKANLQLTSFSLDGVGTLDELIIRDNPLLDAYNFTSLAQINGEVHIENSFKSGFSSSIETVGGRLRVGLSESANHVNFHQLKACGDLIIDSKRELAEFKAPKLTSVGSIQMHSIVDQVELNLTLDWKENSNEQATFKVRKFCEWYAQPFKGKNYTNSPDRCDSNLCKASVELTNLNQRYVFECETIEGDLLIGQRYTDNGVNHPKLINITGSLTILNSALTALSFPNLKGVAKGIKLIEPAASLETTFSGLKEVDAFEISGGNPGLVRLNQLNECRSFTITHSKVAGIELAELKLIDQLKLSNLPNLATLLINELETAGTIVIEDAPDHTGDMAIKDSFQVALRLNVESIGGSLHLGLACDNGIITLSKLTNLGGDFVLASKFTDVLDLTSLLSSGRFQMRSSVERITLRGELEWEGVANFSAINFCKDYQKRFKGKKYTTVPPECHSTLCDNSIRLSKENQLYAEACTHIDGDLIIPTSFKGPFHSPKLESVNGKLIIEGSGKGGLTFINLNLVKGGVHLQDASGIDELTFKALHTTSELNVTGVGISHLAMDQLIHCEKVTVVDSDLGSLSFKKLPTVDLELIGNPKLSSINLDQLKSSKRIKMVDCPETSSYNLSNLETVSEELMVGNSFKLGLQLPKLKTAGQITVKLASEANLLSLPKLTSCRDFAFYGPEGLPTMELESLQTSGRFKMANRVNQLTLHPHLERADHSNLRAEFNANDFCKDYEMAFIGKNYTAQPERCQSDLCSKTILLTDFNLKYAMNCEIVDGDYIIAEGFTGADINHPKLRQVKGNLRFANERLSRLRFENLEVVEGAVDLLRSPGVNAETFTKLSAAQHINVEGASAESLAFGSLKSCRTVSVAGTNIKEFSLPATTSLTNLSFANNSNLEMINLNELEAINHLTFENDPRIKLANMPKLTKVQGNLSLKDSFHTGISLDLQTIGGDMIVESNSNPINITLAKLDSIRGTFQIKPKSEVDQVSLPNVKFINAIDMVGQANSIHLNDSLTWKGVALFNAKNFCREKNKTFYRLDFTTADLSCKSNICDRSVELDDYNYPQVLNCTKIQGVYVIGDRFTKRDLNHHRLREVSEGLTINRTLDAVSFGNLEKVIGPINLINSKGVHEGTFAKLNLARIIYIEGEGPTQLDLNALQDCYKIHLNGTAVESLDASKLAQLGELVLKNNLKLNRIQLPAIYKANVLTLVNNPNLQSIQYGALATISRDVTLLNSTKGDVSLNIGTVNGKITLGVDDLQASIAFPTLKRCGDLIVDSQVAMRRLDLPQLLLAGKIDMRSKVVHLELNATLGWGDHSNDLATFYGENFCADYRDRFKGKHYENKSKPPCFSNICQSSIVLTDTNRHHALNYGERKFDRTPGALILEEPNLNLTRVRFAALKHVEYFVSINTPVGSTDYDLPLLTSCKSISASGNGIRSIKLDSLETCSSIIVSKSSIESLSMTNLTTLNFLYLASNPNLQDLMLARLSFANTIKLFDNPTLKSDGLGSLREIGNELRVENSFAEALSLSVESVAHELYLKPTKSTTRVALRSLKRVGGKLYFESEAYPKLELPNLVESDSIKMVSYVENVKLNATLAWKGVAKFMANNFCTDYNDTFVHLDYVANGGKCRSSFCEADVELTDLNLAKVLKCEVIRGNLTIGAKFTKAGFDADRLVEVFGSLVLNSTASTISLKRLAKVYKSVELVNAAGITDQTFPALVSADTVTVSGLPNGSLRMPALAEGNRLRVKATLLQSIAIPSLSTAKSVEISDNPNLSALNLSALIKVNGSLALSGNPELASYTLDHLNSVEGSLIIKDSFRDRILLPALNTTGSLDLKWSAGEVVALNNLTQVGGDFNFEANSTVDHLSLPKLEVAGGFHMSSVVDKITLNPKLGWEQRATFGANNFCHDYASTFVGRHYTSLDGGCASSICQASIVLTSHNLAEVLQCEEIKGSLTIDERFKGMVFLPDRLKVIHEDLNLKGTRDTLIHFPTFQSTRSKNLQGEIKLRPESPANLVTVAQLNINGELGNLSLPRLRRCEKISAKDSKLTQLSLPSLEALGEIELVNNLALIELNLNSLNKIDGSLNLENNPSLANYHLGSLTVVNGDVNLKDSFVDGVHLNLESVGGEVAFQSTNAEFELGLPNLKLIGGEVGFTMHTKVKDLSLNDGLEWRGMSTFLSNDFCNRYECKSNLCQSSIVLTLKNVKVASRCEIIVGDLTIDQRFKATEFNPFQLVEIAGDLNLDTAGLNSTTFTALSRVGKALNLNNSKGVHAGTFPNLGSITSINLVGDGVPILQLNRLVACKTIRVENSSLEAFTAKSLTAAETVKFVNNRGLSRVELDVIATISKDLVFKDNPTLSSYNLSSLDEVTRNFVVRDSFRGHLNFPTRKVSGTLEVDLPATVPQVTFEHLRSVGDLSYAASNASSQFLVPALVSSGTFIMHRPINRILLNPTLTWDGVAAFGADNFCHDYERVFVGRKYTELSKMCASTICDTHVKLTKLNLDDVLECTVIRGNYTISQLGLNSRLIHDKLQRVEGTLKVSHSTFSSLSFARLAEISKGLVVERTHGVDKAAFNRLKQVETVNVGGEFGPEFNLNSLTVCHSLSILNSNIERIEIPAIPSLKEFRLEDNLQLSSIDMPNLSEVEGDTLILNNPALTTYNFSNWGGIAGTLKIVGSLKGAINLPLSRVDKDMLIDLKAEVKGATHSVETLNLEALKSAGRIKMRSPVATVHLHPIPGKPYVTEAGGCRSTLCDNDIELTDQNANEVLACEVINGTYTIGTHFTNLTLEHPNLIKVEDLAILNTNLGVLTFERLSSAKAIRVVNGSGIGTKSFVSLGTAKSLSITGDGAFDVKLNRMSQCEALNVTKSTLRSLSARQLNSIGSVTFINNPDLNRVDLSVLEAIHSNLHLEGNNITDLLLTNLQSVKGDVRLIKSFKAGMHVKVAEILGDLSIDATWTDTIHLTLNSLAGDFNFNSETSPASLSLDGLTKCKLFNMGTKVKHLTLNRKLKWVGNATFLADNFCKDYYQNFKGRDFTTDKNRCDSNLCHSSITLTVENESRVKGCKVIDGNYTIDERYHGVSVTHPELETVQGDLNLGSSKASTIQFDRLNSILGNLTMNHANGVTETTFPHLNRTHHIRIVGGDSDLKFLQLKECGRVLIHRTGSKSFAFPKLASLTQSLAMPTLKQVDGDFALGNNARLKAFDMSNLREIGGGLHVKGGLKRLALEVTRVGNNITLISNGTLEIDLSNLTRCDGVIHYHLNTKLKRLNLGHIKFAGGFTMGSYVENLTLGLDFNWKGKAVFLADNFCTDYRIPYKGRLYEANHNACSSTICEASITLSEENESEALKCKTIQGNFTIDSHYDRRKISHPNLRVIEGDLIISGCRANQIELKALMTIKGSARLLKSTGFNRNTFPKLSSAKQVIVEGEGATDLQFDNLRTIEQFRMLDTSLERAAFPLVGTLTDLELRNNPKLTKLDLSFLRVVKDGCIFKDNANLDDYHLHSLVEVMGSLQIERSFSGELSLPLERVGSHITLMTGNLITDINLDKLVNVGGNLHIAKSDGIHQLDLSGLEWSGWVKMESRVKRIVVTPKLLWNDQAKFLADNFCQDYKQPFRGKFYVANGGECESNFCDQDLELTPVNEAKVLNCTSINGDLLISNNYSELTFRHTRLKEIAGSLTITSELRKQIEFPNLVTIRKDLMLIGNIDTLVDPFAQLVSVRTITLKDSRIVGQVTFYKVSNVSEVSVSNTKFERVQFNSIKSIDRLTLEKNAMRSLSLDALADVSNEIHLYENPNLTLNDKSFKSLKRVRGSFTSIRGSGPVLRVGFETVGKDVSITMGDDSSLVDMKELTRVGGNLTFYAPEGTTNLTLPKLLSVRGNLNIGYNINQLKINTVLTWTGEAQLFADNFCTDYYKIFQYRKFASYKCTRKERNYKLILVSACSLLGLA